MQGIPEENSIPNYREEALREYYFAQQMIDGFNDHALKIKSWSVTISALAIGLAVREGISALFILASASSLIFWMTESLWKFYQYIAIERSKELEHLLNNDLCTYNGPGISAKYRKMFEDPAFNKARRRVFWYWNVVTPHIIVVCLGIVLWLLTHYQILNLAALKST
jgi:hypothetical protein